MAAVLGGVVETVGEGDAGVVHRRGGVGACVADDDKAYTRIGFK